MARANALASAQRSRAAKGAKTEADYADVIKMYEAFVAEYREEESGVAASMLGAEAYFYRKVLKDDATAAILLKRVVAEFPSTNAAKEAALTLEALETASMAAKGKSTLAIGSLMPNFLPEEFRGAAPSLDPMRGKATVVVFWSIASEAYGKNLHLISNLHRKYRERGLEVVGINLDQDQAQVAKYTQLWDFSWSQFVIANEKRAEVLGKYGISTLPAFYLIDSDRKVIANTSAKESIDTQLAAMLPDADRQASESVSLIKVPLSVHGAPLVVNVSSEGNTLRMLVDTGAEASVLDPVRQDLIKSPLGGRKVTDAHGVTKQQLVYAASPMELQSWIAKSPAVLSYEMDTFSALTWEKLDGVLGMKILGKEKLLLNYSKGEFEVHTGTWRLNSPECISKKLVEDEETPVIRETINGHSISLIVDTGSADCLQVGEDVFNSLLDEGYIKLASEKVGSVTSNGLRVARRGFFTKGRLMGRELRDAPVIEGAAKGRGLLGLRWLCGFDLEIDLFHREIKYLRLSQAPLPVDIEKMIGAECVLTAGGLQIGVLKGGGSAEKAGLRVGDVLLDIDGLRGTRMNRDSLASLMYLKALSEIKVRYRRDSTDSVHEATLTIPALAHKWDEDLPSLK